MKAKLRRTDINDLEYYATMKSLSILDDLVAFNMHLLVPTDHELIVLDRKGKCISLPVNIYRPGMPLLLLLEDINEFTYGRTA